jgi:hypothetical protein
VRLPPSINSLRTGFIETVRVAENPAGNPHLFFAADRAYLVNPKAQRAQRPGRERSWKRFDPYFLTFVLFVPWWLKI